MNTLCTSFAHGNKCARNNCTHGKNINRKPDFTGLWRKKLWRPNNYYECMINASMLDNVNNELNNTKNLHDSFIIRKAPLKKLTNTISLQATKSSNKSCVYEKELIWKSSSLKTLGIDTRSNNSLLTLPEPAGPSIHLLSKKTIHRRSNSRLMKNEKNMPFTKLNELLKGKHIAVRLTPNLLNIKSNKKAITKKHLLNRSQDISKEDGIGKTEFKIKILIKRKVL